jgi:hypothetical protein
MRTLDEIIKEANELLAQAGERQVFGKVDNSTIRLPDEQRKSRIAQLNARIADLEKRRDDVAASWDRAIADEKAELEKLKAQVPPTSTRPAKGDTDVKPKRRKKKPAK